MELKNTLNKANLVSMQIFCPQDLKLETHGPAVVKQSHRGGSERLSEKAGLTIVGWVQPTAFSEGLVGCTHPTKSFPDSL